MLMLITQVITVKSNMSIVTFVGNFQQENMCCYAHLWIVVNSVHSYVHIVDSYYIFSPTDVNNTSIIYFNIHYSVHV